jgi:hypothetical protein
MSYIGKRKIPFIWETPSGLKINFALGTVKTQRAGLKFIREGSGVQINIINKNEVDVKKTVTALMPNFIHSLDANNIHELTDFLHNLKIKEIKKELEEEIILSGGDYYRTEEDRQEEKEQQEQEYLIKKYTYDSNSNNRVNKDNTLFDISFVFKDKVEDLIKMGAFKNNIPLYTIHDCFATTAKNMEFIKKNITLLFSEMYFSTPYIHILHIGLLKEILKKEKIFGYPLELVEFITEDSKEKNDKLNLKNLKKVKIVQDKIIDINSKFLKDPQNKQDIFDNKYYLFTEDKNIIPLIPPMINENIKKHRETLRYQTPNSTYLIS